MALRRDRNRRLPTTRGSSEWVGVSAGRVCSGKTEDKAVPLRKVDDDGCRCLVHKTSTNFELAVVACSQGKPHNERSNAYLASEAVTLCVRCAVWESYRCAESL